MVGRFEPHLLARDKTLEGRRFLPQVDLGSNKEEWSIGAIVGNFGEPLGADVRV